jgi:tetratricopeptide (TPR) repeat protein
MLAKYAASAAALSSAMKVVTEAFNRSETNADAWGTVMQQSTAAYNTFLDTLRSGNWDNFFSNLDTAIKGAKDLYNALDNLGSVKANNKAAIALTNKAIADLKLEKQSSTDASRIKEIDAEIKRLSSRLTAMRAEGVEAQKAAAITMAATEIQNRYNVLGEGRKLSIASAEEIAMLMFKRGHGFFTQQAEKAGVLERKGQEEVVKWVSGGMFGGATTYKDTDFKLKNLSDSYQKQYLVAKAVTEAEAQLAEAIDLYAGAVNESTQATQEEYKNKSIAFRNGMAMRQAGKGGGSSWMGGAIADRTVGTGVGGISMLEIDAIQPTQAAMAHFSQWVKDNPPAPLEVPVVVDPLEELKGTADGIAEAFGAASGALSQFASESKAAAVAAKSFTIAGSIATLVGQFASIPKGKEIWSWIAGTIAGTGTLVATIASIKNATKGYSEGGKIKGAHSTGDMIPIMANAGEIVLSTGMQRNVAAALTSRQGGTVDLALRGDQIVGCINNYGRGHGLGKIVFQP